MKSLVLKLIDFYQRNVSFVFRFNNVSRGCRFYPSCSEYGHQAIEKHGLIKGIFKLLKRILKCNPLSGGGIDLC